MITFTNCKINLGLNIVGRRDDGYHNIETCMLPVPWHDVIEIVPKQKGQTTLTVLGNKVDCPPEKNLVMKAYNKIARRYNIPPLDIVLQKIVPDGAGLGGGSSDAAHTLRIINSTFDVGISDTELAEIASSLGADCAFFIYDCPMLCEGIGDVMEPVDLKLGGHTVVIAKPLGVSISTKEAYSGVVPRKPSVTLRQILSLPPSQWQGNLFNDFEESIFRIAPQIGHLKQQMLTFGAIYASMSGSGASVYGIFDNDRLAECAAEAVKNMPHFYFKVNE